MTSENTTIINIPPPANPVPDTLTKKNRHERDQYIQFDEGPHIYYIRGKTGYTSPTFGVSWES